MITFPPARIPTDPSERIEPYVLEVNINRKTMAGITSPIRADSLLYSSGFNSISGKWFKTDSGILFKIIDATATSIWSVKWFYWNGKTRRINTTKTDKDRTELLNLLSESWIYEGKEGDALYDEAELHLDAASKYNPKMDSELIAENLDLLLSNTDRVLSDPSMVNGAIGGLRIVFIYLGMKRYPISALLTMWKQGKWIISCKLSKGKHNAYVLSGGGGLSNGCIEVYCPTCKRLKEVHQWSTSYFTSIGKSIPLKSDGLRLDEIIEELKAINK